MSQTAIVMNAGATLDGRALAQTAVTLDGVGVVPEPRPTLSTVTAVAVLVLLKGWQTAPLDARSDSSTSRTSGASYARRLLRASLAPGSGHSDEADAQQQRGRGLGNHVSVDPEGCLFLIQRRPGRPTVVAEARGAENMIPPTGAAREHPF